MCVDSGDASGRDTPLKFTAEISAELHAVLLWEKTLGPRLPFSHLFLLFPREPQNNLSHKIQTQKFTAPTGILKEI